MVKFSGNIIVGYQTFKAYSCLNASEFGVLREDEGPQGETEYIAHVLEWVLSGNLAAVGRVDGKEGHVSLK